MRQRTKFVAALGAVALLAGGCSSSSDGAGASATPKTTTLTVLAAASLTEAFGKIGQDFEAANPGTKVTFSFGPSDGLAQQIDGGAPADVFASASPTWMDDVQKKDGVTDRSDFARNKLTIITPKDNPAGIKSVQDLANPGVQLVLAAPGVPAGDYAREMLKNAGIYKQAMKNVVSNEVDVKGVIQKVLLGEADAGIGYATDVTTDVAPKVQQVVIPNDVNVIATYPIAVVGDSKNGVAAQAFLGYVTGSAGQQTLASFGFLPPPGS